MIRIRAPGRINLFGEHQDYLNYPVIAMAISKYIYLEAKRIDHPKFEIYLPDIERFLEIKLNNKELEYHSKRDYLRSGYNQLLRNNTQFTKGYKIKIYGNIPINAGAASSSALVTVWLQFLNLISNASLTKYQIALKGYDTEVKEFGEAGGKMDFFSSTFGNVIYLEPNTEKTSLIEIPVKMEGFILANSLEKKETVNDLRRIKSQSLESFRIITEIMPNFNRFKSTLEELKPYLPNLEKNYQKKIVGNLINRDITLKAKELILTHKSILNKKKIEFQEKVKFYSQLGKLLNKHQVQLKDNIGISTQKIDNMIMKSLEEGALGAKINGSGFGGTMFALSLLNQDKIITSLKNFKADVFKIKTSNGVEVF